MNGTADRRRRVFLALAAALAMTAEGRADPLSAVQLLREGGCGGTLPAAPLLHHDASLDRVSAQWASGQPLAAAALRGGYGARTTAGLHIRGRDFAAVELLEKSGCRTFMDRGLRDIGLFRRGQDTWIVLASPIQVPPAQGPVLATRALQLVNEVRARGARCGQRSFAPAPPVTSSDVLARVALGHAADMAIHDYFEHEDLTGHSPADRVRSVGYREKLVGENIAYGPKTAEEVVQGWLDSPGHCENIMDPRFAEMGIAYSPARSKPGLYWVQVLAAPRA